jgi:hypothetical protein
MIVGIRGRFVKRSGQKALPFAGARKRARPTRRAARGRCET